MSEGFGVRSLHPFVMLLYYAGGIAFGMLLFHPLILLAIDWHIPGFREPNNCCVTQNAGLSTQFPGGRELTGRRDQ